MRSLLAPLFGFALLGAVFAGVYYDAGYVERGYDPPRFRMDPGEARADLIWDRGRGEAIMANITVRTGGPVDVYLVDVERLSPAVTNGTLDGATAARLASLAAPSLHWHVNSTESISFEIDGETRWYLVYVSRVDAPPGYAALDPEDRIEYHTEISVQIRYLERETRSLVFAYLFAIPSLVLITVAFLRRWRQRGGPPGLPALLRYPADRDL